MPKYRHHLPQLADETFLTDGGLETTLIYDDGFELPDFAAFVLLADPAGREALVRYFDSYAEIAARDGVGVVLETATWRASADWATRLGYDATALAVANRDAVDLLLDTRRRHETAKTPIVISGCVGPRGDGYQPDELMDVPTARDYHASQIETFAGTEADVVTAITMTYQAEAIGIVEAARSAGMPVVVSFTVETDGTLPTGEPLGHGIRAVDEATSAFPAYYMINCAHPTHFSGAVDRRESWTERLGGVRANASKLSHAELDAADELDSGDPDELASLYNELRGRHPQLTVLGGCCGTSSRHIDAISRACASSA
jgi:S-methylmethionine-dependent homocysteine/selenocysteine methylase